MIAVKNKYNSSCINVNLTFIEQLFVKIYFGSRLLIFVAVYFPPASSYTLYSAFSSCVRDVMDRPMIFQFLSLVISTCLTVLGMKTTLYQLSAVDRMALWLMSACMKILIFAAYHRRITSLMSLGHY